jgi:hypothetical protein
VSITLTRAQVDFLDRLAERGERGYTISGLVDHRRLEPLIDARYVTSRATSADAILYVITELGRQALEKAKR